jgi:hypothetical protein
MRLPVADPFLNYVSWLRIVYRQTLIFICSKIVVAPPMRIRIYSVLLHPMLTSRTHNSIFQLLTVPGLAMLAVWCLHSLADLPELALLPRSKQKVC